MRELAVSVHGVSIRLTAERWQHISQNHPEMAGYYYDILEAIEAPETVRSGTEGECIAERFSRQLQKRIIVVYRENENDGFVITAFTTKRTNWLAKRPQIWP